MGIEASRIQTTYSVLIVALPGRLRDGLQALVRTMPQVVNVVQADDEQSALQLLATVQPALILLDADISDGFSTLMAHLQTQQACVKTIFLTSGEPQGQHALTSGADAVLHKGFPLLALNRKVAHLMHPPDRSRA